MLCWLHISYAMQGLTTFQYEILAVLADVGPCKGLTIKTEMEDRHPKYDGEVNHGRLYPNLDTLAGKGYIDKGELDARTNEYALTESGRKELTDRTEALGGKIDA